MGSCGGHVLGTGTIYSPGFPGYYMENQNCTWHVSAQQSRSILEFEFVLFNVDEEADSVTLYEMMNGRRRNIEVSNLSATSCSNTVYVMFKSGINGGTRRGIFSLKYREVPNCPVLPSYVGGILYYKGVCPHLIGETVSITCKTGFKLSSLRHTVKCRQDATWNGTLPECIAIDCGNPGEVENADRIGTQYSYNSTVVYTCHDGYYTNSNRTIRCTIEGRWTEKPSCFLNETQLSEDATASGAGNFHNIISLSE
ncbi:seizure protein 6 homolog [Ptychodera flava]|uniref:seizure protein 6 homolog n=1 Tax=Ptychodera flava TaxID=63121 RepID=UPI00396A7C99